MPMLIRKTQATRVDEGMYKAVVGGIQEKAGMKGGVFYIWTFLVKNAAFKGKKLPDGTSVTGITSNKFSKKSKMYDWAHACGIDVTKDQLDLEDCINCKVRVKIEDNEDVDGRIWSKVEKVHSLAQESKKEEEPGEEEADEGEEVDEDAEEKSKKKSKKSKEEDGEEESKEPASEKNKKGKKEDDDEGIFDFGDDEEDAEEE